MKRLSILFLLAAVFSVAQAQMVDPVKFSSKMTTDSSQEAEIVFSATIDKGWHVYSTHLGDGGPIEASFHVEKMVGAELVGELTPRGKEISEYDEMFDMRLRYFENNVQFVQKIRFTADSYDIDCYLEYGACNDQSCLPPSEVTFRQSGKSPAKATLDEAAEEKTEAQLEELSIDEQSTEETPADSVEVVSGHDAEDLSSGLWTPVIDELKEQNGENEPTNSSLWYIFLMGLVGGFVALLTPCVWPIIPMTVSFFLKRAKDDHRRGIKDAIVYGVSIIVIYLSLGLIITGVFGASSLNALSTSAIFNLFLFALLVVFGVSFLGFFEIRLPEKWGNAIDSKASATSGLLSIFLMAFTLSLVSFSCTGPIIGFLLVEVSVTGSILGPAIGMFGFALALALPFMLFAMFPSWLKSMPRSGNWMTTIKVVLGFVELAFALKFFSVADLSYGWGILSRELFFILWIAIFALMGLYLIGWLRLPCDVVDGQKKRRQPWVCIVLGVVSLAFAAYMVPGLWGAQCKAVSAFSPPMSASWWTHNEKTVEARFTSYEEGVAAAREEGKPILIDFTGFGCVNCRKMEAAVWTDPEVARILQDDYVLISLFVDDKTALESTIRVTESNGGETTLRSVGALWSYLQRHKFGANAQPFYVTIDNDGQPLCGSYAFDEDVAKFLKFLQRGLKAYREKTR